MQNRVAKANQFAAKRKVMADEIQRKADEEYGSLLEARNQQIADQRKQYAQTRRAEKMKKRAFNVEICSEVLDLIVDVANEAFEKQAQGQPKMAKPEWREWMRHFVNGRPLSHVLYADNVSQHVMDFTQHDEEDANKTSEQVIDELKNDHAMTDLLSYFSTSGSFFLTSSEEWLQVKNVLGDNQIFSFEVLNQPLLNPNPELGLHLEMILAKAYATVVSMKSVDLAEDQKTTETAKPDAAKLPTHLPLKLALRGRRFAGK